MLSFLTEFEGKELASVAKGGLDLGQLETKPRRSSTKKRSRVQGTGREDEDALADKAKVRVTFRLTDSPACLVADENELSGNLVRMLKAAGQAAPESKPTLEINPTTRWCSA
jgi:molecular chaperone HtpG